MTHLDLGSDERLGSCQNTRDERRTAALYVASVAVDAADCRRLLAMVGLTPGTTTADAPINASRRAAP